tara:strand:- start:10 stop:393 length:384 start_codon:yes stop_codon:yes gene_type:complete
MDHIEQRMLQVGLRSTLPRIGSRAAMAWVLSNWHDWPEKFQRVVTLEVFDSLLRGQIEDESLREDWNDIGCWCYDHLSEKSAKWLHQALRHEPRLGSMIYLVEITHCQKRGGGGKLARPKKQKGGLA